MDMQKLEYVWLPSGIQQLMHFTMIWTPQAWYSRVEQLRLILSLSLQNLFFLWPWSQARCVNAVNSSLWRLVSYLSSNKLQYLVGSPKRWGLPLPHQTIPQSNHWDSWLERNNLRWLLIACLISVLSHPHRYHSAGLSLVVLLLKQLAKSPWLLIRSSFKVSTGYRASEVPVLQT